MDKQEIEYLCRLDIEKLAESADPEIILQALAIGIQTGRQIGASERDKYYKTMFAGYNEITIAN